MAAFGCKTDTETGAHRSFLANAIPYNPDSALAGYFSNGGMIKDRSCLQALPSRFSGGATMKKTIWAGLLIALAICATGCTYSKPITVEVMAAEDSSVLRGNGVPTFKLFWSAQFEDALSREIMKLRDVELVATSKSGESNSNITVLITGSVMNNAYGQLTGFKVGTGVASKEPKRFEELTGLIKSGEDALNKWATETAAKIEAQFIEPLR
jgi:hypothetical protein